MKPIDGPRCFFPCPINMRRGDRQHQQLVFGYLMFPSGDFTPAFPFSTINKYNFRTSIFPRANVTAGFGIIPRIRRQKLLEQRILQGSAKGGTGQNHEPLARKPFVFFTPLHTWNSRGCKNNYQHRLVIATFSSTCPAMMHVIKLTKKAATPSGGFFRVK